MEKIKVIIFGIGNNTSKIIGMLNEEVEIVLCVDNNCSKHGAVFMSNMVEKPEKILTTDADWVIVAIKNGYEQVVKQIVEFGYNENRIIAVYSFSHDLYKFWREVIDTEALIHLEYEGKMNYLSTCINNMPYEIADGLNQGAYWIPSIADCEETIQEILDGKSISRFGDGEFDLILGRNNLMQENDSSLAKRLREILVSNEPNHIVALPDVFGAFCNRTESFTDYFRKYLSEGCREKIYSILDKGKRYYNAFVSRLYTIYTDKSQCGRLFTLISSAWAEKDVTIIEGEKTRLGMGNDLLYNASSVERILCPATNAFKIYDDIYRVALNIPHNRIVLIALGATATVLAYDLSKNGYQALDIGHLDIEYELFLRRAEHVIPITGKYVNEAPLGICVQDDKLDREYLNQIVCRLGV